MQLLKAAYNQALRAEKITRNLARSVKLFKENNIRVRYLTEDEERRLVAALPEYLRPLVTVAIHTGLRRGELLSLRWEDVDFSARVITVRVSKSGEGRRMPINEVVFKTLGGLFLKQGSETAGARTMSREIGGYVFRAREGGYFDALGKGRKVIDALQVNVSKLPDNKLRKYLQEAYRSILVPSV